MEIIRHGQIVEDDYQHLDDDAPLPAESRGVIVSLARFQREREALLSGVRERLGVRLPSDAQASALADDLHRLALVAVEFPKFTDGRGYTIARLLRERHGFRGELRAVGHVLRDQLFYMTRCGFDAFELAPGKSLTSALEAFGDFSVTYQAAADQRLPLYRRR